MPIRGKRAHTIIIDEAPVSPRLFPEEKLAFQVAQRVLRRGPTRHVINYQGEAKPWPKKVKGWTSREIAERLSEEHPYVYMRDDNWSLAASKKLSGIAKEQWDGRWVGHLEVRRPDKEGRIVTKVVVYPQNGPAYTAGYLDETGEPFDIETLGKEGQEHVLNMRTEPISIEELRAWMRAGCPR